MAHNTEPEALTSMIHGTHSSVIEPGAFKAALHCYIPEPTLSQP